jgi:ABC-type multidrug transport system fused ATPase/permease subunit
MLCSIAQVVELGTYDELVAMNGEFAKLVKVQVRT